MAAGDSAVSICNMALTGIGQDPIASLGDPSKRAILCKLWYDQKRRELLRNGGAYNFSKRQAALANSPVAPLFDYSYAYVLPADFIKMWDENEDEAGDMPDYEILNVPDVGTVLMSDDGPPFNAVYVYDAQDPTQFDSLFVASLAAALGEELAPALTASADIVTRAANKAAAKLEDARLAASQEASVRELDSDIWLRSRW